MTPAIFCALTLVVADPAAPITALAVAPDQLHVVAGSQAGLTLRSLPALSAVRALPTKLEHVHDLAFSTDGQWLAAAGGSPGERGLVEIWAWPAGRLQETLPAGDDLGYDAAWNASGTALAVACADKAVRILSPQAAPTDARVATATWRPHSAAVLAVAWLPEPDLVISSGVDQAIRVLQPADGVSVRTLDNHTAPVRALALRPHVGSGPAVIASAGADRTVRFWQPTIGRLVRFARLPTAPTALCWTASGSHALIAGEDGRLRAIDYETLAVTDLPDPLSGRAHALTLLPGGKSALLAGERGELRIVLLAAINP